MFTEALESRLKILEDEILRLTNLASQTPEKDEQANHWLVAKDLQREANALRAQIKKSSASTPRKSAMQS